jgi:dTDP-4-dehydrorhamnose reductase
LKILLFGPAGQVGWELGRSLASLGKVSTASRRPGSNFECDLLDIEGMRRAVRNFEPDVIVNAAAYTAVDSAESEVDLARRVNAVAPGALAEEAARSEALLVHYSTDYVFDGSGQRPWSEEDTPDPINAYGRTKLEGEQLVRQAGCRHLLFRTSWVFAARGRNFLRTILRLAKEREQLSVVNDQFGAPTSAELIADATSQAIRHATSDRRLSGTWHLCASGETSWFDYARRIVSTARSNGVPIRLEESGLMPTSTADFGAVAARPRNSRLSTRKLRETFDINLPDWESCVDRAMTEIIES